MKWVIEILNDRLRQMNDAYDKFVVNGNADANGDNAKSNRDKVEQLTNAIKILSTNIDTSERQLTIPVVSKSIAIEYAEFCIKCDREKLPLLCLEDYIKQC